MGQFASLARGGCPGSPQKSQLGFCRATFRRAVNSRRVSKENHTSSEPADVRQRLNALREALLALHKALLASERVSYEATFGKITSPYQFLQLLTNDPWFAWLMPVTRLITKLDEILDAKEPLSAAGTEALMAETRTLLVASEGGEGFSRHYDEAMQRSPDVVFAHAAVAKLIRPPQTGK